MISQAGDLARRLARDAEAVCRHYLSNGRRCGHYWVAGDVMNTPGRSLYVRLHGPEFGPGAAGKWTDAATGEHGDLLDLIGRNRDLHRLGEAMDEARFFLALPRPPERIARAAPAPRRSPEAARRLFRAGRPIAGTPAEAYLRARGITGRLDWPALRYHPSVYYRESDNAPLELWPALLAAVTGLDGTITGILRTWLDPRRPAKAPLADPRRALGHLLGNGVRFGRPPNLPRRKRGSSAPAKASKPCSRSTMCCPRCPSSRRSPPTTSPHSNCLRRCAVSMSPATTTRPVSTRRSGCTNAAAMPASTSATSSRSMAISTSISAVLGLPPCSRTWRLSSTRPTGRVFCRVDHQASVLAACAAASVTREEEAGAAVPRVVCLPAFKRAARAAFPSGDLPEAPGGQPCPREGGGRRPEPGCNGAGQLFSAAARRGRLCIAKQNSCPAAILRVAAAPEGCNPSPPPAGDRCEGRDGRG
jgi:hypothetical protein